MPECARRGISVLMAAPFNSGILATGARPGATFVYAEAEHEIVELTHCHVTISPDFWDELKRERLIAADAPVPSYWR